LSALVTKEVCESSNKIKKIFKACKNSFENSVFDLSSFYHFEEYFSTFGHMKCSFYGDSALAIKAYCVLYLSN